MSLRAFLKYTAIGRIVVVPYRFFAVALPLVLHQLMLMLRWTFTSKEHYNHTYHLTELNRAYLDSFISVVSGHELSAIARYSKELETDADLRQTLEQRTLARPDR